MNGRRPSVMDNKRLEATDDKVLKARKVVLWFGTGRIFGLMKTVGFMKASRLTRTAGLTEGGSYLPS